jgi:hypothetical protein
MTPVFLARSKLLGRAMFSDILSTPSNQTLFSFISSGLSGRLLKRLLIHILTAKIAKHRLVALTMAKKCNMQVSVTKMNRLKEEQFDLIFDHIKKVSDVMQRKKQR